MKDNKKWDKCVTIVITRERDDVTYGVCMTSFSMLRRGRR